MLDAAHSSVVRFGPFEVNLNTRELRKQGTLIRIPEQSFAILALLLEQPGELVTREEIVQRLWGDNTSVEYDQGIAAAMSKLRRALSDSALTPRYIETVRQRGFRLLSPVAATPESATAEPARSAPPAGAPIRRWTIALAAVAALAVLTVWRWTAGSEATAPIRSLAVLPFHIIGGAEEDAYLELGITDALIANLSHMRKVAVRPSSAVRKYAGQDKSSAVAARELDVDAVLEGTVQRTGGLIRVTVQLVRASNGQSLWASQFDGPHQGALDSQDTIARRVASELSAELSETERARIGKRHTASEPAFAAYQKGRYLWNLRTPDSLDRAAGFLEEAIRLDPGYAMAHAALADTYALQNLHSGTQRRSMFERAKAAAEKALTLDPLLAEAHATSAYIKVNYEWDWPAAERSFLRAIELNPNYSTAHQWYAELLYYMGRMEEAIVEIEKARRIEPQSVMINLQTASPYLFSRRCPEALPKIREALKLDPQFPLGIYVEGVCLMDTGDLAGAAEAFRKIEDRPFGLAGLGVVFGRSGKTAEARKVLARLTEAVSRGASPYHVARIYANLGEPGNAIAWLRKAVQERDERVVQIGVDSQLDPIRGQPAFQEMLKRLKLDQASQ